MLKLMQTMALPPEERFVPFGFSQIHRPSFSSAAPISSHNTQANSIICNMNEIPCLNLT